MYSWIPCRVDLHVFFSDVLTYCVMLQAFICYFFFTSVVYDARACVRACVCVVVIVHWHCSAQLSMFNMEKRYRNKITIIRPTLFRLTNQNVGFNSIDLQLYHYHSTSIQDLNQTGCKRHCQHPSTLSHKFPTCWWLGCMDLCWTHLHSHTSCKRPSTGWAPGQRSGAWNQLQQNTSNTLLTLYCQRKSDAKAWRHASATGRQSNLPRSHTGHASHMEITSGGSCGKICEKARSPKETGGHNHGSDTNILWRVYTGAVRPIMEYATTSWATASNVNKSRLDKVQNVALRAIVGAMKTTPIKEMEKRADLEPLELLRAFKVLTHTEKIQRLPGHPLHKKLAALTKNRLKRHSLNHLARDLRRTHEDILDPQINEGNHLCSRDWNQDDLRATIFLEVPGLLPAEQKIPTQQMALTLEMLEEKHPHADWTHIHRQLSGRCC